VPVGDPEAMAAALGRLLDDRGLARALAERGRAAVERFTVERAVATYAAVLEEGV
jgi:glycosyltransferase involved in cell wall biosynthesis